MDAVDAQVSELTRCSPNFGFLTSLVPLLAIDGATTESYIYADPDAAMMIARRFTETLARELVVRTQTRVTGGTQHDRIKALAQAGVLVPEIQNAFDRVRRSGNRAAHSRFGEIRAALEAVRTCFELGVWFHRAVTGDPTVRPFVPPPNPDTDHPALNDEDHAQLNALHADVNRHSKRLAEALMHPDHPGGDHLVRSRAGEVLARAEAEREQLRTIVAHVGNRLAEVEAAFNDRAATPPPVSAADRDAFIASAREAARWVTDIACSAVASALNRRMQLDVATWTGPGGETLTVTYTADGGFRVTGTLRAGRPVVDRPCPDRQSLMMALADLERMGYRPADDEGTRVVRAVLLIPGALEFLSAADVTAPPACPPWCVTDHGGYVDWFHECRGSGLEMRSLDGQLIGAEPVRLTDACTGEAHEAMVRVCDTNLDPAAARQYAEAILAAAAMIDPMDSHTTPNKA